MKKRKVQPASTLVEAEKALQSAISRINHSGNINDATLYIESAIAIVRQQQPASPVIELLESIVGTLEPISQQNWHGKWRIHSAIELARKAHALAHQHTREPDVYKGKYTIRHSDTGYAAAIERDGYTALQLDIGTTRNEEEIEEIVALLNQNREADVEAGARAMALDVMHTPFDDMPENSKELLRDYAKACYLAAGWTVKE